MVAYLRTSSLSNAGDGKDSYTRQLEACQDYAKRHKMTLDTVHDVFYDAGVSGTVPVGDRPQFSAMLCHVGMHDMGTILVEDASATQREHVTTATLSTSTATEANATWKDHHSSNLDQSKRQNTINDKQQTQTRVNYTTKKQR